jgi:8-oxo-dGTP pyrophosphatase MutT (NUDIX family)
LAVTEPFDLASLKERLLHPEAPLRSQVELPIASVAIIIATRHQGGSVLLIKRTERGGDPWSGQIGFPGGHKSPTDPDFLHTALRETEEEVGIKLSREDLLGSLPIVTTRSRRVQVASFVFQLESTVTIRMNREVAESFWVPLTKLSQLEVKRRTVQVEEGELQVNCYDYDARMIWGLTFRLLNLLLGRTREDEL